MAALLTLKRLRSHEMGWDETGTLAVPENREVQADLNGQWIDQFYDRNELKYC